MTLGLFFTSVALGMRHGVDWDHIAAIADLTGAAHSRRRGFILSFLYAAGHALVVFVLGILAIATGTVIPDGVDTWMSRVVGVTLIALGAWIIVEIIRKGRDFRLRSRWILIVSGTFAGLRRVRHGRTERRVTVDHSHPHPHDTEGHQSTHAHDHAHISRGAEAAQPVGVTGAAASVVPRSRRHTHPHRHDLLLPTTASGGYGGSAAAGIGMLHGVGVESPTQIALFVASTSVAGTGFGVMLLVGWVAGLIVANSMLAVLAGFGLLHAERNFAIYATIAVTVAVLSVAMGALFVIGIEALPDLNL